MEAREAMRLALGLMEEHGLTAKGWGVRFNRRMGAAGTAVEKRNGEKLIELSLPFVRINSEESVRQTILHEIAHALRGVRHGHDRQWKLIAKSIGGSGNTYCNDSTIAPMGIGRWLCGHCGTSKEIHRHPKKGVRYACSKCLRRHGRTRMNITRFEMGLEYYGSQ